MAIIYCVQVSGRSSSVGSSGVFSNLSYPDSFIAFQRHYAMSEINKT